MTAPEARAAGRLANVVRVTSALLKSLTSDRGVTLPEGLADALEVHATAVERELQEFDGHFPAPEPAGFEAWWGAAMGRGYSDKKEACREAYAAGAAQAQAVVDAAERLCRIYFEIASEAIGEDAVTAERDKRLPPEPVP